MNITSRDERTIYVDAPAKINLFLEVLGKRPDGYHEINSLLQAVSVFDRLTVTLSDRPGVSLTVENGAGLSTGPDNLVCRAYELMRREFGLKTGLAVKLEKDIPVAAGLAGGSTDAAATIAACSILNELDLDREAMARLGARIGSDVPFFFSGGQALVTGRGEIITETDFPTDYHLVLVTPDLEISTAEAYAGLRMDLTKSKNPFRLPCCRAVEDYLKSLGRTGNDFEAGHLKSHPVLGKIKDELLKRGAALARMSGSGPTMFGVFTGVPDIEVEINKRRGDWRFLTVAPITLQTQATLRSGRHRGNH